ncbi:hypothetical protein HDU92_002552 [Lobulomyces angularis]|nr:hypothetical protein HDU92_002552 [Lobulomyces angularis]
MNYSENEVSTKKDPHSVVLLIDKSAIYQENLTALKLSILRILLSFYLNVNSPFVFSLQIFDIRITTFVGKLKKGLNCLEFSTKSLGLIEKILLEVIKSNLIKEVGSNLKTQSTKVENLNKVLRVCLRDIIRPWNLITSSISPTSNSKSFNYTQKLKNYIFLFTPIPNSKNIKNFTESNFTENENVEIQDIQTSLNAAEDILLSDLLLAEFRNSDSTLIWVDLHGPKDTLDCFITENISLMLSAIGGNILPKQIIEYNYFDIIPFGMFFNDFRCNETELNSRKVKLNKNKEYCEFFGSFKKESLLLFNVKLIHQTWENAIEKKNKCNKLICFSQNFDMELLISVPYDFIKKTWLENDSSHFLILQREELKTESLYLNLKLDLEFKNSAFLIRSTFKDDKIIFGILISFKNELLLRFCDTACSEEIINFLNCRHNGCLNQNLKELDAKSTKEANAIESWFTDHLPIDIEDCLFLNKDIHRDTHKIKNFLTVNEQDLKLFSLLVWDFGVEKRYPSIWMEEKIQKVRPENNDMSNYMRLKFDTTLKSNDSCSVVNINQSTDLKELFSNFKNIYCNTLYYDKITLLNFIQCILPSFYKAFEKVTNSKKRYTTIFDFYVGKILLPVNEFSKKYKKIFDAFKVQENVLVVTSELFEVGNDLKNTRNVEENETTNKNDTSVNEELKKESLSFFKYLKNKLIRKLNLQHLEIFLEESDGFEKFTLNCYDDDKKKKLNVVISQELEFLRIKEAQLQMILLLEILKLRKKTKTEIQTDFTLFTKRDAAIVDPKVKQAVEEIKKKQEKVEKNKVNTDKKRKSTFSGILGGNFDKADLKMELEFNDEIKENSQQNVIIQKENLKPKNIIFDQLEDYMEILCHFYAALECRDYEDSITTSNIFIELKEYVEKLILVCYQKYVPDVTNVLAVKAGCSILMTPTVKREKNYSHNFLSNEASPKDILTLIMENKRIKLNEESYLDSSLSNSTRDTATFTCDSSVGGFSQSSVKDKSYYSNLDNQDSRSYEKKITSRKSIPKNILRGLPNVKQKGFVINKNLTHMINKKNKKGEKEQHNSKKSKVVNLKNTSHHNSSSSSSSNQEKKEINKNEKNNLNYLKTFYQNDDSNNLDKFKAGVVDVEKNPFLDYNFSAKNNQSNYQKNFKQMEFTSVNNHNSKKNKQNFLKNKSNRDVLVFETPMNIREVDFEERILESPN